jgi:hypothetical protein
VAVKDKFLKNWKIPTLTAEGLNDLLQKLYNEHLQTSAQREAVERAVEDRMEQRAEAAKRPFPPAIDVSQDPAIKRQRSDTSAFIEHVQSSGALQGASSFRRAAADFSAAQRDLPSYASPFPTRTLFATPAQKWPPMQVQATSSTAPPCGNPTFYHPPIPHNPIATWPQQQQQQQAQAPCSTAPRRQHPDFYPHTTIVTSPPPPHTQEQQKQQQHVYHRQVLYEQQDAALPQKPNESLPLGLRYVWDAASQTWRVVPGTSV